MNHARMTLVFTAIVALAALATVAFAAPHQVLAYRHNHHSIKVDQQINQENQCSNPGQAVMRTAQALNVTALLTTPQSGTVCVNLGSNSADVQH